MAVVLSRPQCDDILLNKWRHSKYKMRLISRKNIISRISSWLGRVSTSDYQHAQWSQLNESKADSRLLPSQWETSLQYNVVSHWLGANLEATLESINMSMVPTSNSSNIHISTGRIWRFSVLAVLQTRFITPTLHLIRKDRCRVITEDIEGHPGQEAEFPACNTSISVIPSLFAYRHPNPFMYKLYTSFIVAAAVSHYIQMWDRNKMDYVF